MVFELYADGFSIPQILDWVDAVGLGITKKEKFDPEKILSDEKYLIKNGGMVRQETWDKVQELLKN